MFDLASNERNLCSMKQKERLDGVYRRQKIVEILESKQKVSGKELAEMFLVSEMTIRRDFHQLEDIGIVELHYGGASLRKDRLLIPSVSKRDTSINSGKRDIGRVAASYLKNSDTIFLDAGSTVFQMLRFLPDIHLKVITNSMPIIELLYPNPKIELYVAPGRYNSNVAGMIDISTLEYIRKFHIDKAFIGAFSCNLDFGVACNTEIEAVIKSQMLNNSDQSFLLVDHKKFDLSGPIFQNKLSDYSYILTDEQIDDDLSMRIKQENRQLIVCSRL